MPTTLTLTLLLAPGKVGELRGEEGRCDERVEAEQKKKKEKEKKNERV